MVDTVVKVEIKWKLSKFNRFGDDALSMADKRVPARLCLRDRRKRMLSEVFFGITCLKLRFMCAPTVRGAVC